MKALIIMFVFRSTLHDYWFLWSSWCVLTSQSQVLLLISTNEHNQSAYLNSSLCHQNEISHHRRVYIHTFAGLSVCWKDPTWLFDTPFSKVKQNKKVTVVPIVPEATWTLLIWSTQALELFVRWTDWQSPLRHSCLLCQ